MTSFQSILLVVLVEIVSFSGVVARRSRSRRYSSYYSGSGEANTDAIIAVCVILGFFAIIATALILRAKCCPFWSPKEAISDCICGCKCCKTNQQNKSKIHISTLSPTVQLKERKKTKSNWTPVKRHVSDLKIVMQTPKPVLIKRESKEMEKNIALYESNPMHYRNFMEPPPAYEYIDPPPETKKQDESEFLQNRQRISRISRTVSALRIEKAKEEAEKLQNKSAREDRRLKRVHSAL